MGKIIAWIFLAIVPPVGSSAPLDICRLPIPVMHAGSNVGLGFPRIPYRLKTVGDVRFTVLFADFGDAPALISPQDAIALISPQAERFFNTVSYGRLNVRLLPSFRWIRMSRNSDSYHSRRNNSFEAHTKYIQEAIDRAGSDVDFSASDAILVLTNPGASAIDYGPTYTPLPGSGAKAGGRYVGNAVTSGSDLKAWGWSWFNHEVGHAMSLVDLGGLRLGSKLWHTYVGDFSVMGNIAGVAPEYFAWERWQLGWLDDSQVICASEQKTSVKLSPIERKGGVKMVIVPTGPWTAVVVESRRAEGYDRALPKPGLLAYTIDTRLTTQEGAIRIQPQDDKDDHYLNAPLSIGQTLSVAKVNISYTAADEQGDSVTVTLLQ